ncbi:MAG: response regulator [Candidatus Omnitrophota bacterium]|nr:response regulator [Candidatus Omnitrophota bacterium]
MPKLKILIVDDDPDILELIEATLDVEFQVVKAATGKEALEKVKTELPGLLVLDYMLPDLEGTQICATLRKDSLFLHLPILMLTGKGEIEDKVTGLEAGADDYMVKPFSPQELLARIRMLIRRSNTNLDANPLTRLPGNVSIAKELETKLANKEIFAVLYVDIDNFKALNDYYGFKKGDEVIKEAARIIINSIQKKGTITDFIGHIGGDDFVLITAPKVAENIAKNIISEFDRVAPKFFEEKDSSKGYIETRNREGTLQRFGFLTISIGIITNLYKEFTHTAQISSLGAEIKGFAKKFPESKYIFDKRVPEDI